MTARHVLLGATLAAAIVGMFTAMAVESTGWAVAAVVASVAAALAAGWWWEP